MSQFTKNEDGTVSDSKTGLTWSHTLGEGNNYATSEQLVAALGPEWRVPTDHELLSIVDRSREEPAIDTDFFPDTKNDWYWTSTPCTWNEAAVWVVGFSLGVVGGGLRSGHACVRAVRSSQ